MARKKKPDKLAIEAGMAKAAGMSYGKWKAMQQPEKVEGAIPEGWLVCEHCGRVFKPKTKRPQKYCEVGCQREAWNLAHKESNAKYMREYRERNEPT